MSKTSLNLAVNRLEYWKRGLGFSLFEAKFLKKSETLKHIANIFIYLFYLFGVLRHFQHYTGHITTGSFVGRGNQYIQLAKVLYCKLSTISRELPAFPHKVRDLKC